MADWAKIPAGALGLVKSANRSLLKVLETDDQLLEAIQVDFQSMVRELRENGRRVEVTCFFEDDENRDSPERDMVNPSSEDSYMWPIRGAL